MTDRYPDDPTDDDDVDDNAPTCGCPTDGPLVLHDARCALIPRPTPDQRRMWAFRTGCEQIADAADRLGYADLNLDLGDGYPYGVPARPAVLSGARSGRRGLIALCWLDVAFHDERPAGAILFRARIVPEVRSLLGPDSAVEPVTDPTTTLELGSHVYVTDGAQTACTRKYLYECLERHRRGDYGLVGDEDRATNDTGFSDPSGYVLSAYPIDPTKPSAGFGGNTVWIITQGSGAQRHTTILTPDEY